MPAATCRAETLSSNTHYTAATRAARVSSRSPVPGSVEEPRGARCAQRYAARGTAYWKTATAATAWTYTPSAVDLAEWLWIFCSRLPEWLWIYCLSNRYAVVVRCVSRNISLTSTKRRCVHIVR